MKFEEWEPVYNLILKDMGFDSNKDEQAALLLSKILETKKKKNEVLGIDSLRRAIEGQDVLVCGKAPKLEDEIKDVEPEKYLIIAADGATSILMRNRLIPNIIVTDLDGNVEDEAKAGAIMVVHAHGDNMEALRKEVPRLKMVIGTTQSKPLKNVYNFGGFTDGDRSVFLAKEMGARSIRLIGFDFKDENVTPLKKKKLVWAEKLIKLVIG